MFGLFLQGSQAPLTQIASALHASGRPKLVGCDLNLRQAVTLETLDAAIRIANFVKLNEAELARVASLSGPVAPAEFLLSRGSLAFVVETRGAAGARFVARDGSCEVAAPVIAEPSDSIGAGDALMAALMCALLRGEPPQQALRLAVAYASAHLSQVGALPKSHVESR
ncbi:MAG: carbohydrate kinase family protein [Myxococcota bacterium]